MTAELLCEDFTPGEVDSLPPQAAGAVAEKAGGSNLEEGGVMSDENEESGKESILWHQSGVNRDGEPFIQLIRDDKVIAQQSPQQARDHALAMLEAAEAAEQDAFLMHWVKERVGGDEHAAAGLLQDFRKWRMEQTGKRSGMEVIPEQREKKP